MVPLPFINSESNYQSCCGNWICWACHKENEASINKQNEEKSASKKLALTCPFCREPYPTCFDEELAQLQARCLHNDCFAFELLGAAYGYRMDENGMVPDDLKALDCYIRAVELGSSAACVNIAYFVDEGNGVAINEDRAALFWRVGALRGSIEARNHIGCSEYYGLQNYEIGIRHWKIAAEAGYQDSIDALKKIYNADGKHPGKEFISQEEMDKIYRSGHDAQMEVKTEEREKHKRR